MDVKEIDRRLEGVSELKEKKIERKQLRESLKGIQDIERLTSRIFLGHANARDLIGLKIHFKAYLFSRETPVFLTLPS